MAGVLFLVATPIGNLADITLRAKQTLSEVDLIACEDTRHTLGLLTHLGIQKRLISYHKHNEKQSAQKLLLLLAEGKRIALVSDAGMPGISDPGAYLVSEARRAGIEVVVIPGASAVTAAVALSGIDEGGFVFLGFLQGTEKEKSQRLSRYAAEPMPLVIYSAPHDIKKELALAAQVLGSREALIIKEMTKVYEAVIQGVLGEIEPKEEKGEFVLIISGCKQERTISDKAIIAELDFLLGFGLSKRDASTIAAQHLGIPRKRAYDLCLAKLSQQLD